MLCVSSCPSPRAVRHGEELSGGAAARAGSASLPRCCTELVTIRGQSYARLRTGATCTADRSVYIFSDRKPHIALSQHVHRSLRARIRREEARTQDVARHPVVPNVVIRSFLQPAIARELSTDTARRRSQSARADTPRPRCCSRGMANAPRKPRAWRRSREPQKPCRPRGRRARDIAAPRAPDG